MLRSAQLQAHYSHGTAENYTDISYSCCGRSIIKSPILTKVRDTGTLVAAFCDTEWHFVHEQLQACLQRGLHIGCRGVLRCDVVKLILVFAYLVGCPEP